MASKQYHKIKFKAKKYLIGQKSFLYIKLIIHQEHSSLKPSLTNFKALMFKKKRKLKGEICKTIAPFRNQQMKQEKSNSETETENVNNLIISLCPMYKTEKIEHFLFTWNITNQSIYYTIFKGNFS